MFSTREIPNSGGLRQFGQKWARLPRVTMWFTVTFDSRQRTAMLYGYSSLQEGSEFGTPDPDPVVFQV
jgi:hypothetical protein